MNTNELVDRLLNSETELGGNVEVEVRYFVGGETKQFPIASIFTLESPAKKVVVIEVAVTR